MVARRHYRSYLLRLWQVYSEGVPAWRAMLEESAGGERHGFADLDALCAWIKAQAEEIDRSAEPSDGHEDFA